ncbi:hypothetical protein BZG36_02516 [Bifiguratus adelaidae]|uniref:Uncharacterized protein n=1 Tax=Bifiguratus adelaidae TaxID=1938954 RepID=A0A261Y2S5_9FUNG|nr:hypothetical protein BZG36_02516 [Bifiguratus adelaidae]
MGISDKCCCCIPLRIGVLIISLLLLGCNIFALVELVRGEKGKYVAALSSNTQFAQLTGNYLSVINPVFYALIAVAALYGLASVFGAAGSILRNRPMTMAFSIVNWIMVTIVSLVVVGTWIYYMTQRNNYIAYCTNDVNQLQQAQQQAANSPYTPVNVPNANVLSGITPQECQTLFNNIAIAWGVIGIVGSIILIYFAFCVGAYAARLKRRNQHTVLKDLGDEFDPHVQQMAPVNMYESAY